MINSITGNSQSSGMRVASQSTRAARTNSSQAAASSTSGSGRSGVTDNFKSAIISRVERAQKAGLVDNTSSEAAQKLADSLGQAAEEVKKIYGQEAANSFMGEMLKDLDRHGFSYDSLTQALGTAVRQATQGGLQHQMEDLAESFNRDLGSTAEGDQAPEVVSLNRGIADFFGLENQEKSGGQFGQGLTADGTWGEVAVNQADNGLFVASGSAEAAEQALRSTAGFSLGDLNSGTIDELTSFLRDELGAEEAAAYLENRSDGSGFMYTMDTVINKALNETASPAAASKLESYLNNQMKTAVNASMGINAGHYGRMEFSGWDFSQVSTGSDGRVDTGGITSSWRFTERDDVIYTRSSQNQGQPKEKEAGNSEAEDEDLSLGALVQKVSGGSSNTTGELVNTTV